MAKEQVTGMHELLDALEAMIKAAPRAERDAFATVMEAYAEDFPDDYYCSVGPQSPTLLYHLIHSIEAAATDDGQNRGRLINLSTRKPEGNAQIAPPSRSGSRTFN